jgi:actin
MLTEAPLNPHSNRERMAQIMFETFQVPALYIKMQAVLALMSTGQTTGLATDIGDGVAHTVPVYEGYAVDCGVSRLDLAGSDLTDHLMKLLRERGSTLSTTAEREIVRDIKEKHAYVALDFSDEQAAARTAAKVDYELPDGHVLTLGPERFRCTEPLFDPLLLGKDVPGIHECVKRSVEACDIDLRRQLYGAIYLSGGTTRLRGFPERLSAEINQFVPSGVQVKVVAPVDRHLSAWVGGSVLASLDSFRDMWVTRADYAEHGAHVVHAKCF